MMALRRFYDAVLLVGLFVVTSTHGTKENREEVIHLIGEPDFRDVALRWEFDAEKENNGSESNPAQQSFLIHYCELQAWGPHRCRTAVIEESDEASNQITGGFYLKGRKRGPKGHSYSTKVSGLRMATTYSFEVRPLNSYREKKSNDRDATKSIIVPTKGFSARATQCLPHASEVEVSTGPYFGGRIAVEAADGERCALSGDPTSSRDTYTLRIDHEECGSEVNDTTVATFVIVQENLPILTHSTRRFLVLCSYKPETLTVRAGINLPTTGSSPNVRYYRPQTSGSVEPFDNPDDSINEINSPRLEARVANDKTQSITQKIMTIILIVAGVAGLALLVWKIVPGKKGDLDNISVASFDSNISRNTIQPLDNLSDTGSIYSISLSECGHCGESSKQSEHADNTSEA